MNRTALALALAACGLPAAPDALAAGPAAPRTLALHCERVFDARSGKVLGEHTVLVRDGRIAEVIPGRAKLADAESIVLADHTCTPGWTDLHVHLGVEVPTRLSDAEADLLRQFAGRRGEQAPRVGGTGDQGGGIFSRLKDAFSPK